MNRIPVFVALTAALLGCAPAEGGEEALAGDGVVVVELFTSQGCSSCPPADRLLRSIADEPNLEGRVIALSFHVDYWNYIGWRDPFSSPLWSERQRRYSRAVGVDVYTPQAVVNGRRAMVGSSERQLRKAIRDEAIRPAKVRLEVLGMAIEKGRVTIEISASRDDEDIFVAIVESGLETAVTRGENSGRKLTNDRVVRWLEKVDLAGDPLRGTLSVDLASSWVPEALGVVAFAQDSKTMEIVGAAAD